METFVKFLGEYLLQLLELHGKQVRLVIEVANAAILDDPEPSGDGLRKEIREKIRTFEARMSVLADQEFGGELDLDISTERGRKVYELFKEMVALRTVLLEYSNTVFIPINFPKPS
ncbi:MAG TPA: hypothetical protein VNG90_03205 [Candidatus Acidoferrum sp.]|nr:hypothetical protein [Candidatus Acidoferrum sp.]